MSSSVFIAGFGILTMALLPNEINGRLLFLLCGSIVLTVGVLLILAARSPKNKKAV